MPVTWSRIFAPTPVVIGWGVVADRACDSVRYPSASAFVQLFGGLLVWITGSILVSLADHKWKENVCPDRTSETAVSTFLCGVTCSVAMGFLVRVGCDPHRNVFAFGVLMTFCTLEGFRVGRRIVTMMDVAVSLSEESLTNDR